MKKNTVRQLLHKQMELLAEKSKDTYPASDELSQNSFAMSEISSELLKRETVSTVLLITLGYFFICFTIHRK